MDKQMVEGTKKLPLEVYYARFKKQKFHYPVTKNEFDKDGNPVPKYMTSSVSGNVIEDANGEPIVLFKSEAFDIVETRFSKGYLSKCVHDPNDKSAQNVARGIALRKLAEDRSTKVYREDEFEKMVNYDKWVEKQKRIELEGKLAEAEAKAAKVAELEKRLSEIAAKKG